ncbi:MAG: sulfatase-like hydrolase/transferase [Acidobacteriaceae bacterium]
MTVDRRNFLMGIGASVAATGMNATTANALPITRGTKPLNVVLMICDDLGFGDSGCYGSQIPTPNLDRLAAQGTRCMRYNSAHPICSASRAALLTGRYAPRSHTEGAIFPSSTSGMSLDETTLANLFHNKGYRTHAIGKWHLGQAPGYLPTNRGFDTYLGVPYSVDMKPLPMFHNLTIAEPETNRDELTPRYTAEAVQRLEEKSDSPFFMYLAYSYPHDPARGSKNFSGRSAFGDVGDAIEEIDWSVGQVLDTLERTGHTEDTVVIFTSDHGPWFQGAHGATRGRKGSTFEGGVRVPFIIRWPGHVPSATVCSEWLCSLNVLPTLAAWCGLEQPKLPLDGFDMSETLLRRQTSPAKPVLYFTPAGNKDDLHGIRSAAWKLRIAQCTGEIYTNDHTMGSNNYLLARPELYHLENDPTESYDVAKKHPDTVRHLLAELNREIATFPPATRAEYAHLLTQKASIVTPPGASPRILTGPEPDWAWEEPERR